MKKLILLLSVSILFQSCFSYKSVDYNKLTADKKQKIEVEMLDKTNFKGQLVFKDETTMVLENTRTTKTIKKDEIYDLKVRKISILKTVKGAASSYLYIGIGALAILSLSGFP
ncbi:hypothetical protein N9K27_00065 [Flavobacteriaceae bacterium]|nr:hypothetical protein [Flavobacteriaceae bacterium]